MFCPNCGSNVSDLNAVFCPECGARLSNATQPVPTPAQSDYSQQDSSQQNTYQQQDSSQQNAYQQQDSFQQNAYRQQDSSRQNTYQQQDFSQQNAYQQQWNNQYTYCPPQEQPVQNAKYNGLSIAGFCVSCAAIFFNLTLFGLAGIAGLILSIIGLRQCNARGDKGRGLAIAGIVIGAVLTLLTILTIVLMAIAMNYVSDFYPGFGSFYEYF